MRGIPHICASVAHGETRFTDEADQQRALIEMHGLYCLSRPMRISPATAKNKQPQGPPPPPAMGGQYDLRPPFSSMEQPQPHNPVNVAMPLPPPTKSVSAPMASATSAGSIKSASTSGSGSVGGSNSLESLSTANTSVTSYGSADMMGSSNVFAQLAQQYSATGQQDPTRSITDSLQRFTISEESWKHHAQARAILGNLIGPNGEQLTSTDPYNTTVFVGGLSPLISEDTLRTFFAPFGDIHYVSPSCLIL